MTQWISGLYVVTLAGLALYALHFAVLMLLYLKHRRDPVTLPPSIPEADLPAVTVQLPLRNEPAVALRALHAAAALRWPGDRLQIQALDDSDDETTALLHAEIARYRAAGVAVTLLHRERATGYKAGALAEGLRSASGEYIAIFDADFCPPPDFLLRTVPHLVGDPALGWVQARWGHLNVEYSAVTRAQAIALDAYFIIEQTARCRAGLPMNFNGTAGVWRRQAIEEAGGWQSDTVAEDLDLSYRAQLAGWKPGYLPDVVAPAELPPLVTAFKQQQYRWAKGTLQCLRKLSGLILRSPHFRPHQKVMALLHISGYGSQSLLLLLILLTVPLALWSPHVPTLAAAFGALTLIPHLFYIGGQIALYRDWPRRVLAYPALMFLGIGIAWSTTLALLDGARHWGGEFVRTPKYRLGPRRGGGRVVSPYRLELNVLLAGEFLIGLYAMLAVILTTRRPDATLAPISLLAFGGAVWVVGSSLYQHACQIKQKGTR